MRTEAPAGRPVVVKVGSSSLALPSGGIDQDGCPVGPGLCFDPPIVIPAVESQDLGAARNKAAASPKGLQETLMQAMHIDVASLGLEDATDGKSVPE